MSKKPLLSIGMIVKNEIRSIEKCLKALQPLRDAIPCELVIADTGSTDGTREVIMRYADVFFDFEWINDFAAARNAVMDRCSGEWYLTVDADEYLDSNISEFVSLLSRGIASDVNACTVVIRNYSDKDDLTIYHDFYATRMARMSSGIRYQYPIHEALSLNEEQMRIAVLGHVVFWHDGYLEQKGRKLDAKRKRNLSLLEQQLQEVPNDLRVTVLAADSACTAESKRYYARRLVELIESGEYEDKNLASAAWQRVLSISHEQDMWEFDAWYEKAKQVSPNSFYVRVDGNHYAVEVAWKRQEYVKLIGSGKAYLEGAKAFKNATPEEKVELLFGNIYYEKDIIQVSTELAMACAHGDLEQWDECRKILKRYSVKDLKGNDLSMWLQAAGKCAAAKKDKKLWNEIHHTLETIEDWESISSRVIMLVLENDLALPNSFFSQNVNRLTSLAGALGGEFKEKFPCVLKNRTAQDGNDDDWKVVIWNQMLLSAALIVADWESDDKETLQWLMDTYAMLTDAFLNFYYNPEILQEEMVVLLPDMHRFGWCFLQAKAAREADDTLSYVRWLRKILKAIPSMKEMIEYLLESVNKELEQPQKEQENAVPSELLALAAQVRTVLAQYAPDDPAVIALKQTPVYQKVANLIEND